MDLSAYLTFLQSVHLTQSLIILLFVVVICRYSQHWWQHRHIYNLARKLNGPKSLPFIGNAFIFLGNTGEILTKFLILLNKWDTPMKVSLGSQLVVTITKPEHIKTVLTKTMDKGILYRFINEPMKTGLLSSAGSTWKKHRRIIQPTFSQKVLNTFFTVFLNQSILLTKILEKESNKNYFNVFPYLINCTLDAICENALGIQVNSQTSTSKFSYYTARVLNIITQRTLKVWLHPNFIFNLTPLKKELQESLNYLKNFCLTIIQKQREIHSKVNYYNSTENEDWEFGKHLGKRKPFSQLLIESTDLSDEELLDEVLTITLTGSDTIATTVSFTLMSLGMHQNIQEKVYEEIKNIYKDSSRPTSSLDLSKLVYLEMCIKETMRIFPTVPIIARTVTKEFKIDDYVIPKGCNICVPIIYTHQDPDIWPNPKQFNPERFSAENCAKRHPNSYMPFSNGSRNCIGSHYALMFMKIILVNILRLYKVECDMKIEDVKVHVDISLKASNGFNIRVNKR